MRLNGSCSVALRANMALTDAFPIGPSKNLTKIATAAERCDVPHLATRKTAHPGPRSLLRSFPVVEREARRLPAVWVLGRAGLGDCARRLFRRALQCAADPRGIG